MTLRVLDSTVVIDYLNGIRPALEVLAEQDEPVISSITWIEVVAGLRTPTDEQVGRALLSTLAVEPLSEPIAELTVLIRRATRLKLPDAIILATAKHLDCPLVTRNTKDFDPADPNVLIPYEL